MDRLKLSRIDEELDSSEVAALCFLCHDVLQKKSLEGIRDARSLFRRLEDKGLLENDVFLSQLLHTIRRTDLLKLLNIYNSNSIPPEETDSSPILSNYRVMLYRIYDDMTQDDLEKMKFLLSDKLPRRKLEMSNTPLDVFAEMEKASLISNTNVNELHLVLQEFDQQLASIVRNYCRGVPQQNLHDLPHISMDNQRVNSNDQTQQHFLSVSETEPSFGVQSVSSDAHPSSKPIAPLDQSEYYTLVHEPRGLCVIINNEKFLGPELNSRPGTQADEKSLSEVFSLLGFTVVAHSNLTAKQMLLEIKNLSARNFLEEDALVVCVLSHGDLGCVYGTDEEKVRLKDLTAPFTSGRVPTLAGKPKVFFIQACQGGSYQKGALPCPPMPGREEDEGQHRLEEDAGRVHGQTVPSDADFLLGMATVQECKSFRNTATGSIYIQELCKQLKRSAESSEQDDILTVLTRVNREVSQGEYLRHKQMPEPKYTLTKKLVLKFI